MYRFGPLANRHPHYPAKFLKQRIPSVYGYFLSTVPTESVGAFDLIYALPVMYLLILMVYRDSDEVQGLQKKE